ncbi:hypothetical protein vseg_004703 [Gypsophila vaccaria]
MSSVRLRESVLGAVGDAAQNCPLPRRILILPHPRDLLQRIDAGSFYEINHSKLPPDAPSVLYSLRAVMVTAKTEQNVTIRYPSLQSLQAFFGKADRLAIRSTLYPATDEKYVMVKKLAVQVLGHQIPSRQFVEHRHSKSFWLIKSSEQLHLAEAALLYGPAAESNAKVGTCFSTLQRSGVGWGSRQIQLVQSSVVKQPDDVVDEAVSAPSHNEDIVKEEGIHEVEVKLEETPEIKVKQIIQYSRKRKHGKPGRPQSKKIKGNPKQKPLEIIPKVEVNMGDRVDRWSATRYEAAAKELVDVLKATKAFYGHPIPRSTLRTEARKKIGDTGLLDHLLKHLAGKVVPSGGSERLRRRCDANGKMEYWLESADLVNIRKEAGVSDPYWTPPPGWKRGDSISAHNCICCKEVRFLKDELSNLRRKLTELKIKDEKHQATTVLLPESASSSRRFNVANLNVINSKESYELLVEKKSILEEQFHQMSKALKELEEEMKKLSSKTEVEANRKPLMICYSKSWTAEGMNEMNRTSTEDLQEETSQETSDDEEDIKGEGQVTKTLRPIRLRACRLPNKTSHAVKRTREDLVDVTPPSTSPHSTTTS